MLTNEEIVAAFEAAGIDLAFRSFEQDIECARAVEQAAYERAAQECEKRSGPIETYNRSYPHYLECADAIRSLMQEQPK